MRRSHKRFHLAKQRVRIDWPREHAARLVREPFGFVAPHLLWRADEEHLDAVRTANVAKLADGVDGIGRVGIAENERRLLDRDACYQQ
jgi:hypothetical protein